jgi:hypothetical protein
MRTFLVALLLLSAGVLCADVTIHNGLMTADLNSQPLGQVLDVVKTQTTINFSVDEGVDSLQVSASFHDLNVAEAIKKMLEGTGINYVVIGGPNGPESIFIGGSEKPGQPSGNRQPAYRSVVQPVMPQQPVYVQPTDNPAYMQQQQQMNDARRLPPGQQKRMERGGGNNALPPTGGGYAPNQPQPSPTPQIQQVPVDQSGVDDSSDEEESDDSEE